MQPRTTSKKTGRRSAHGPSNGQEQREGGYFNKPRIGRMKPAIDQIQAAAGYSGEPVNDSRRKKGPAAGPPLDGQKPPKRKFNTQPMPSLRLGFAIKCKKDDANQRYELVVESQLANRVYIVKNTKNDRMCCLKIEPYDSANELKQLKRDVFVMLDAIKNPLFGSKHFLPIINKGICHEYFNYLVMPLCDGTLADIREQSGGEFSVETAVRLTFDTFQAITDLHGLGHIHRAISPDKFVVGSGGKGLYLIGLSFCIRINNPSQSSPRKLERFGPNRYQCRNWHRNKKQNRRDDFESWLYMAIDFFGQKLLPWNNDLSDMEVLVQKERLFNDGHEEIFAAVPKQLEMLLHVLKKMDPQDKPDYEFITAKLATIREIFKCKSKGPYDFTLKVAAQPEKKTTKIKSLAQTQNKDDEPIKDEKEAPAETEAQNTDAKAKEAGDIAGGSGANNNSDSNA